MGSRGSGCGSSCCLHRCGVVCRVWQGRCWLWHQAEPAPPGTLVLELLAKDGLSSIFELGFSGTWGWLLGTADWVSLLALVRLRWGALPFVLRLSCTPFLHPLPVTPHTCPAACSPPL